MTKTKRDFDRPQSLMVATQQLLKGKNLAEVSTSTSIPFLWLYNFMMGTYQNPSVNRCQILYEHLANTKLIKG